MSTQILISVAAHADGVLTPELESHLTRFIQQALTKSYSQQCSPAQILDYLDQAWTAQKLLWQLRQFN
jgi:hypothetical protein